MKYPIYSKIFFLLAGLLVINTSVAENFEQKRLGMIDAIKQSVAETRHHLDKSALDSRVLDVMSKVPRHRFVPSDLWPKAYQNRPLPIGHGQTISQPYIVALMTDLIETQADYKVLEIGTGSAYQAAILAELVDQVYSMEIIEPLAREASKRLSELGYTNVHTRIGDGYFGWEEAGPFDAIVVTAASSHVPPPLVRQLKKGGRMVIPVGSRFMTQQLLFVEKGTDDRVTTRQVLPVRFVPLTGSH
jgi:protein-L-isoaspartate(D-aspartate) O-methyltransferase